MSGRTAAQAYRGHETWWNNIRMWWKMIEHVFLGLLLAQIVIFVIGVLMVMGAGDVWVAVKWVWAWGVSILFGLVPFGQPAILDVSIGHAEIEAVRRYYQVAIDGGFAIPMAQYAGYFGGVVSRLLFRTLVIFLLSCGIYILWPWFYRKFKGRATEQARDEYVRGAKLITAGELKREIKNDREAVSLPIGDIKMPRTAEVKHCFVIGRPGVGKTVMISQIFEQLIERKEKIVIYDSKGDYLQKFYNPDRDMIFNPLDTRCPGWSVFNEIHTVMDIDAVSNSLISPAYQNDPFWNDAARDVFAGILYYLHSQGETKNSDIWSAVTAPGKDIAGWLAKTTGSERGFRYIEDASSKQAMSVFAVMMQYVKCFEVMGRADGAFQMDDWLQNDKGGVIYITSYRMIRDTLRPILSLFIDLLSQKLLSMKDDYDRRIFFLLDEFPTLQRLSSLVELLTLSRSKGGSVWLGTQDVGQIEKKYGAPIRDAIVNACGNAVIFSVADPHTAEYLSRKIGDTEYREIDETISMGVSDNRDGVSLIKRKKTEKLILPAQVMQQKDLHAYAQIANYNLTAVELTYRKYQDCAEPIVLRNDLDLAQIVRTQRDTDTSARGILGMREAVGDDNVPDMQGTETGARIGHSGETENREDDGQEQEIEDELQNC
ncbi:MAG: type IV secretion system DNA-binding domain-containing protein [Deltaproteobacteria bacterium]|nr:type IV secretion system DNA-binding domain-containing protein [Deltaproteobacteria bacterium]